MRRDGRGNRIERVIGRSDEPCAPHRALVPLAPKSTLAYGEKSIVIHRYVIFCYNCLLTLLPLLFVDCLLIFL